MQTEDTGTNMNPDINIEVARLRAENSQLQKELTKSESERLQIEDINGWIDSEFQIANKRALQAEAEVERFREAFEKLQDIVSRACNLLNLKGGYHESYGFRNEIQKLKDKNTND
jgi:hypothetical protein